MGRTHLLLIAFVLMSFFGKSSHVLGGDITWTCQGGDYVFELAFYRDCNGADISTIGVNIDVWNHPTVNQITLNYDTRTDVSPLCTQVAGGPAPLDCGSGAFSGSGLGAIEKIIYRSDPITLMGTPPIDGWIFTYQTSLRSGSITNLQNPSIYGITLASTMFAIPNSPGGCVDNSPQFLQEPYFVSCVGDQYEYNMNAVDQDLDSLAISFGEPMDHYQMAAYNPPTVPVPIPFEVGFSPSSPTPDVSLNPGNIAATIHPNSGNLKFLSFNAGNFVIKVLMKSYRQGVLIATVEREMQVFVQNCSGINSAPTITGPFGGLFETTVNAGDLVNFDITSVDIEVLQDGSPQNNHLSATGLLIGPNPTLNSGCAIAPCATLDAMPLITGSLGVTTNLNWQTECDHLLNPYGYIADLIPYHFVFKIQDDYCPIPKVSYATVTINVVNPDVISATQINCIQTDINGDVTLTWDPVVDINASFNEYQIHSIQSGLIASIGTINTSSYTDLAVGQNEDYFILVASGCFGNTLKSSDTVSNIHLNLIDPNNGTAIITWNDPITPALPGMNPFYHIYREYPVGTWTLYDSVPYGTNSYTDTITICSVDVSYQIVLPNSPCDCTSNIVFGPFEDMITPDIPIINSVSIDTITGGVIISWNQNNQPDTYGYIIYEMDGNGIVAPIDTVYGITNTSYIDITNTSFGSLTYTVAAFDSCLTTTVPPTYQTSAKGELNSTVFVTTTLNICAQEVDISWSDYIGWTGIDHYEIHGQKVGEAWVNFGSTTNGTFNVSVDDANTYCFTVEAISSTGESSFSNISCLYIAIPGDPLFNYLQVATVNAEAIDLKHYIDLSTNIAELSIQRMDEFGVYNEIALVPVTGQTLSYTDLLVDVQANSYSYRFQVIDSCFKAGQISNTAKTILLTVQNDDVRKLNYLNWSSYQDFDGSILGYNIYRGINDVFNGSPIDYVAGGQFSYEDDVNSVVSIGKICYYVEAIEAINSFGFSEKSRSNESCIVQEPTIYIPNSFSLDGDEFNQIFLPILSDFDPTDYELKIYNRWGQPIFISNDPSIGWNGIVKETNQIAASGTYLYSVMLIDGNGIEIFKKGHVNLFK